MASNDHINHKLSNYFWIAHNISDAQLTQVLKFWYAQHMGNHM